MEAFKLNQVKITGDFFAEKQKVNATVTIPSVYNRFKETDRFEALKCKFDKNYLTMRMKNIAGAAEIAKWLEGLVYCIARTNDPTLRKWYDEIVNDIVSNQREDGYYHPYFQVYEPELIFQNRDNHELFTAGEIMEVAVAASEYLGDDRLLVFSEKFTDYIIDRFVVKKDTPFTTPGHEEIELALFKMYEHTGKEKYKMLAEFFLNERGTRDEQEAVEGQHYYSQSHLPVRDQDVAKGHAVRAMLLYSGMADMARISGDEGMANAVRKLFDDVYNRKMYITGGIGSSYPGEKFTVPYDLPNFTAFSETCAAFAFLLFCDRMIKLDGKAIYGHVFERILYNAMPAGTSLKGDEFFYVNPLEAQKEKAIFNVFGSKGWQHDFAPILKRAKMYNCPCCPPNVCRFYETLAQYVWYVDEQTATLTLSQYITSELSSEFADVKLCSDMPYSGKIKLKINSHGKKITLRIRVPEWCEKKFENVVDDYIVITKVFDDEELEFDFPMTAKRVYCNPMTYANAGRVAFTYGPFVLCAEGTDNPYEFALLRAKKDGEIKVTVHRDSPFVLCAELDAAICEPSKGLYISSPTQSKDVTIQLIPYFAWANREENDMAIWLPEL